jgi:hypothetical protein
VKPWLQPAPIFRDRNTFIHPFFNEALPAKVGDFLAGLVGFSSIFKVFQPDPEGF